MFERLRSLLHNHGRSAMIAKRIGAVVLLFAAAALVSAPLPLTGASDENDPSSEVFSPVSGVPEEEQGGKSSSINEITDIIALKSSKNGIDPDSEFLITCAIDPGEDNLSKYIEVSPLKSYKVNKQAERKYLLTFDEPLAENSIVSFSLKSSEKPMSWAFQTKAEFAVVQSLPYNKSTRVPVSTGIEIEFSHYDIVNLSECFSIEPSVKGRFEKHGKTYVFVPDSLQLNTLYTVTISGELSAGDGLTLGEDHIFSFRTASTYPRDNSYLHIDGDAWETFLPDTVPVVQVSASDHFNDADFDVKVYRFADDAAYINTLKERHSFIYDKLGYMEDYAAPVAGMELVMDTTAKLIRVSDYYWIPSYIALPDRLSEGYYLVDISSPSAKAKCNTHVQKFIQVHPYAVYSLSVNGSQLVWVNNADTGLPVSGAQVLINGISAQTDSEGLVQVDTPDAKYEDFNVISVNSDILPFVSPLSLTSDNSLRDIDERFYTYIYTDRERYQPTDTVKIWGVVIPRDGVSVPPEKAELRFRLGYYDQAPIAKEVILDASGAFSGEISFEGLNASYYSVELAAGDIVYCSKYFEVGEYTKPSYIIKTSFDRPVYYAWDPITLKVDASFFDGTPAANTSFEVYNYNTGSTSSSTASSNGSFEKNMGYSDRYNTTWRPQSCYYYVSTAGAEDVRVQSYGHYYVIPRDVMLGVSSRRESSGGYALDIHTNRIDISSVMTEADLLKNDYENLRSDAIDLPVTVRLVEVTWIKTQTGTYYDYINKVTIPRYRYESVKKEIDVLSGTTKNGLLTFGKLDLQMSPEKYYYAQVECTDTRGQYICEYVHFYEEVQPSNNQIKDFSFSCGTDKYFSLGETASIILQENWQQYEGAGKILRIVVQNSIKSFSVIDALSFSHTFSKEDIPNICVYGAYFDGKHIYPVRYCSLIYDPEEMKLQVDTESDKQKYLPGDQAHIDIRVTDRDGKPVAGAAVCVSIVDEAAFAVADQDPDPLAEIYSRYFYPQCFVYTSYTQHDFSGEYFEGGGGGEGESPAIRKNFLDTAAFQSVITDPNGRAGLTFTLPDNLTSWRITTLAVADGVYAGHSKNNVITTLPIFADLLVNRVYLKGDDISASARAFGTALQSGEKVDFTAVLQLPDGTKKEMTGAGTQGSYVNFKFGSGPEGEYILTVTAKSRFGSDAIQKSFRVVDSALEIPASKSFLLSEGINISALRSPVTLIFFDPSAKLYHDCLMELASAYGVRSDVRAGRSAAQSLLKEQFGGDLPRYFYGTQIEDPEPGDFQDHSGGVRLLEYSGPEPEITALFCVAAQQYLNIDNAAYYLSGITRDQKSQPEDVAAAYMGLAALNKPVLLDIQYLLKNDDTLTQKAKLYLVAGLALIGDLGSASAYYDELIHPFLEKDHTGTYLKSETEQDLQYEMTALASITAVRIGAAPSEYMIKYLLNNPSRESAAYLQYLYYATNYKNKGESSPISFSYRLNGELKTVTLEQSKPFTLTISTEALEKADFKPTSGDTAVLAAYTGSAADFVDPMSEEVILKKTYESMDGNPIAQSSLIKVTITTWFRDDAPKGWYELTDYIPSGARYSSYLNPYKSNWYFDDVEGQKISFCVKNPEPKDMQYMNITPIVYYVRATLTGSFVTDSAYMKHAKYAAWGMSKRGVLLIDE